MGGNLHHLPLVSAALRELAVQDTPDSSCPHDQNAVTVGGCVAASVLTILTGEHAVSWVAATLAVYDLAVIEHPLLSPVRASVLLGL